MKGLKKGAFSAGAKKILGCLLLIFLLSLLIFSVALARDIGETPIPPVSSKTTGIKAINGARELGLLVLGIGWEAVRIVLPKACPERDKDIDELILSIDERKSKTK